MLVNLTPHVLNVQLSEGATDISDWLKLEPSGQVARVASESRVVGTISGVSIYETTFGEVEGLPEEKEGTYYVVSRLVLQAASNRKDLLSPGQLVRNEAGQPIGCKGLSR